MKPKLRVHGDRNARRSNGAFTLLEVMVVISIIALLSSLLFPALSTSMQSAKRSACLSNLENVGRSIHLYAADSDDCLPWAIDPFARVSNEAVSELPANVDQIPDLVGVLSSYAGDQHLVWKCPSDSEPYEVTFLDLKKKTFPNVFAFAHASYGFPLVWTYMGKSLSTFNLSRLRISKDALVWHCPYSNPNVLTKTENVLFGDGHVRFVSLMDPS